MQVLAAVPSLNFALKPLKPAIINLAEVHLQRIVTSLSFPPETESTEMAMMHGCNAVAHCDIEQDKYPMQIYDVVT